MLSKQDNELLCRVGPGTPMGDLIRQYWIPAVMSSELPTVDSEPYRLRLLGENLIAYRVTSGKVGVIANACPHRGASLFFGRNEEEGLRCVYHGWKFDVSGACVDMPSEPAESNFKSKVRATSYPTEERNGIVWVYMGTRETLPPLPDIEPNMMAEGEYSIQKASRECNFVQALEGDIDTGHLGFLHNGSITPESQSPGSYNYYTVKDRAPRYSVLETEFGTSYGTYRPAEADTYYWRIAHFLFPFYTMIPTGVLGVQVLVRFWVPMDDSNTMFWNVGSNRFGAGPNGFGRQGVPGGATSTGGNNAFRNGGYGDFLPNTSDWFGKWRPAGNRSNDYNIDRELQKNDKTFNGYTGIPGIPMQDQAITESMGVIYERTNEHLGTTDSMVIKTRRRMINAAKALREQGIVPPGVDNPEFYRQRSGGVILHRNQDWMEATRELRKAFVQHKNVTEAPYTPPATASATTVTG